ncbi:complex I subunit 4 family protein [Candidatus Nitrospira salsa]
MILTILLGILLLGGLLAWLSERWGAYWPRWIALITLLISLGIGLGLWLIGPEHRFLSEYGVWFAKLSVPWISRFGIQFHVGADGLSLLLILLTSFLGITAVIASWTEITQRVGFFHFNLLWVLTGVVGVFVSLDLFLFFVFWEMMLVPMYLLISIWGHEHRAYAALKFFLFTQAGGLLMLISILAVGIAHYHQHEFITFDYFHLLQLTLPPSTQLWMFAGFFAAFAVKLPVVPLHTWLPDAHTEAPTGGSVILAGLLLKTGGYGLLRFAVPLFPDAAQTVAPMVMGLGVVGILYGAMMAFAQTDLKRLIAYSSIAHLGFVLLGIFAWNSQALQGTIMQMLAHGISTGALFVLAGALQERLHTRDMNEMGGLWDIVPKLAGITMFFVMASLGIPGLGNFIGEFLVLLGTYRVNIPLAALATLGIVAAAIYSLTLMQRTFHGPNINGWQIPDLSRRSLVLLGAMIIIQTWWGLYPHPILQTARLTLDRLQVIVAKEQVETALTSRTAPMGSPSTTGLPRLSVDR